MKYPQAICPLSTTILLRIDAYADQIHIKVKVAMTVAGSQKSLNFCPDSLIMDIKNRNADKAIMMAAAKHMDPLKNLLYTGIASFVEFVICMVH